MVPRLVNPMSDLAAPDLSRPNRLGRAIWTLLDHAVSSLTNLGLSFVALRSLGLESFGAFTVAFGIYLILFGLNQAMVGQPLLVRHSSQPSRAAWELAARRAMGTSLTLGLLGASALTASAVPLRDSAVGVGLLALGAVLPGILIQDTLRSVFFSEGRPLLALLNDTVWAVVLGTTLATMLLTDSITLWSIILAWGASAAVAAAFGVAQTGVLPAPSQYRTWLRAHRDLWPRFSLETALSIGPAQLSLFLVGGIAGLAALGSLSGARLLFGPVNVLFLGMSSYAIPEGVRMLGHSSMRTRTFLGRIGLGLAASTVVLAVMIMLTPQWIWETLIPEGSKEVLSLVWPVGWWVAAAGGIYAGRMGLRILADARASLRAQLATATLMIPFAVTGAFISGALGAGIGLAIANSVAAGWWWIAFVRSLDREVQRLTNVPAHRVRRRAD